MDRFVTMDQLPEGLQFPPDLAERIHYDPERRRLSFDGFMSKAVFDRLFELSEDWSYRRQLEELFRLCEQEDNPPPKGWRALVALAASVGVTLALVAVWYLTSRMGHH